MDLAQQLAKRTMTARTRDLLGSGLSIVLHLGLLAASALCWPSLAPEEETVTSREIVDIMYPVTAALAERELDTLPMPLQAIDTASEYGGAFADADGASGQVGVAGSAAAAGDISIQGPEDNTYPGPSRFDSGRNHIYTWNGPPAPAWGDPAGIDTIVDRAGQDPVQTHGNSLGERPDDAAGRGGTGSSGMGRGGQPPVCVGTFAGTSMATSPVRRPASSAKPPTTPKSAGASVPAWRRPSRPQAGSTPIVCDPRAAR